MTYERKFLGGGGGGGSVVTDSSVGTAGTSYGALSADAGGCWFQDRRPTVYQGKLIGGFIRKEGDIVAYSYDLTYGSFVEYTLAAAFQQDDHAAPAVYVRPDGRLIAFYSHHSLNGDTMHFRISNLPGNVNGGWSAEDTTSIPNVSGTFGATYANPIYLSGEGASGRLYLFYRGANQQPCAVYSDNNGTTWSAVTNFFNASGSNKPYVVYASNGVDRIDMFVTKDNPDQTPLTPIYHFYYKSPPSANRASGMQGSFYTSSGKLIRSMAATVATPVATTDATLLHDGPTLNEGGWVWNAAYDSQSNPVLAYAVFANTAGTDHRYRYARWNGVQWVVSELTAAGGTIYDGGVAEPFYSAGVIVDPNDADRVWACVPVSGQWELQRWVTVDRGKSWRKDQVTASSSGKNIRPFVPRGSGGPQVFWYQGVFHDYLTAFNLSLMTAPALNPVGGVNDTFSDVTAGVDLASHTGEVGATWTKHPTSGATVAVGANGQAYPSVTNSAGLYYASWAPSSADYTVSTDVVVATAEGVGSGPCGRMDTTAATYYHVRWNASTAQWQLFKFVAGTSTQLGSSIADTLPVGTTKRVSLVMVGTTISVLVNGVSILSVTDSAVTAAGKAGLRASASAVAGDATHSAQLDNFVAQ